HLDRETSGEVRRRRLRFPRAVLRLAARHRHDVLWELGWQAVERERVGLRGEHGLCVVRGVCGGAAGRVSGEFLGRRECEGLSDGAEFNVRWCVVGRKRGV
ncbi:hypothetical protein Tdes44962_MAKER08673, partial [Teratosphaeria destructans]